MHQTSSYMTYKHNLGIHLFRNDLRLLDNEAITKLCEQCHKVTLVYLFDPAWLKEKEFNYCHLGAHRHEFLNRTLLNLKKQCVQLGLDYIVLEGKAETTLCDLIKHANITCVSYEFNAGYFEREQITYLKNCFKDLSFIEGKSNYLLNLDALPFDIEEMPNVFSPFRRKIEKYLTTRAPLCEETINGKPASVNKEVLSIIGANLYTIYVPSHESAIDVQYQNGEISALQRLNYYFFDSNKIASYKETRNGLEGWDFSSRLSAFLALGCISPAYVYKKLQQYENTVLKNESTYWLFFELLWREFFHLQAIKHGIKLFRCGGIQENKAKNQHHEIRFKQWVDGQTDYPIVNACMRQLAKTGFMSNRGRQLVASCFVHELQLDWRYGAKYFEHILIDFDVASNYGNWQYLAGVGSDPRGHRQFNLDKQTQTYDPHHNFINNWLN